MYFQVNYLILVIFLANIVIGLITRFVPFVGWIVGLVGGIFVFVCWILGLIAAIQQEEKEVPLLGKIRLLN